MFLPYHPQGSQAHADSLIFIVAPEEAYEATKAPIVSYISIELREKQEGQRKIPET